MAISKRVQAFARFSLYGLAILLGPVFLIRYFVYPSRTPGTGTTSVASPPQGTLNPNFASRLQAAQKQFQDGLYADALAGYLEAEKAVPQLNDAEYAALRQARLQLAAAYESAGQSPAANKVYIALVSCALREAKKMSESSGWDQALARTQDAEQFAHQVTGDQRLMMYRVMDAVVAAQRGARRLSDALHEQQRLVDYLENGERDELLAKAYANLGSVYADLRQWDKAEQALNRSAEISGLAENQQRSAEADFDQNFVDYQLVSVYLNSGQTDLGLVRAEEYYTKYQSALNSLNYNYPPNRFATLGLALARQAKKPEAISLWEGRTHVLSR